MKNITQRMRSSSRQARSMTKAKSIDGSSSMQAFFLSVLAGTMGCLASVFAKLLVDRGSASRLSDLVSWLPPHVCFVFCLATSDARGSLLGYENWFSRRIWTDSTDNISVSSGFDQCPHVGNVHARAEQIKKLHIRNSCQLKRQFRHNGM